MVFYHENWTKDDYQQLLHYLKSIGEEKLKNFHKTLVPNVGEILGIRLPILRTIAKEIAKGNWQEYFKVAEDTYYEEIMLQGMVIGYIRADLDVVLRQIEKFVPKINNWAVCDSFCAGLKILKKHPRRALSFLEPYFKSKHDFALRFAIVMRMLLLSEEETVALFIQSLQSVSHEGYYVKMAVAWALSVCFVKFPDLTLQYLQQHQWDAFTYKRALQKIIESRRVEDKTKVLIRQMVEIYK